MNEWSFINHVDTFKILMNIHVTGY